KNQVNRSGSLVLHPNPNSGLFFVEIETDSAEPGSIFLTDITGRVVFSLPVETRYGLNTFPVDVKQLAGGIYSVSFKSPSKFNFSSVQVVVQDK
ncbi:MAG: T9SS type A sorting domain-containing protein, partial [Bacteroidota bacterium]